MQTTYTIHDLHYAEEAVIRDWKRAREEPRGSVTRRMWWDGAKKWARTARKIRAALGVA